MASPKIVVIGAGVGGLTTATLLAKAGLDVTVLEAHVYPGGCAGTFYHKGYRFDAGATLAGGFYPGGPMDLLAQAAGIDSWPAHPDQATMMVHLADGSSTIRWSDERRWQEWQNCFGAEGERFAHWQEATADALWALALRVPPWPPQSPRDALRLLGYGLNWLGEDWRHRLSPRLAADLFRPVAAHLHNASPRLRQFVDAQLLIAAQTTSAETYALYGASALDLPRRGVVHLEGGIGAIGQVLADALRRHGGKLLLRQEVNQIRRTGDSFCITTKRKEEFAADMVVANLPPWNIRSLLQADVPPRLRQLPAEPQDGWGAFMLYLGVDVASIPADFPLHHQIVAQEPLGEGNSIFLSFSPEWDKNRAPSGQRVITVSTHTRLQPWWQARAQGDACYEQRKAAYQQKMLQNAMARFPWLHEAVHFSMTGTPVTFHRFTRRHLGWVGGFPQTSLWRTWAPKVAPKLWMVGDSIFPGQSTAAVALGGMRVAQAVLDECDKK